MPTYNFVAPRLPDPPREYTPASFELFNNALRLYFRQLDEGCLLYTSELPTKRIV